MKFLVDEMPENGKCLFNTWIPFPPFMEEPGTWKCKNDNLLCKKKDGECRWMKELKKDERKIL